MGNIVNRIKEIAAEAQGAEAQGAGDLEKWGDGLAFGVPLKEERPSKNKKLEDYPGDYVPGYRIRASQLSENSSNSGVHRDFVWHALMIKPLNKRLRRNVGDILCNSRSSWGVRGQVGETVTCQDCNSKIRKYELAENTDPEVTEKTRWY